jgi:DNA-3-methyladenine glycosylase
MRLSKQFFEAPTLQVAPNLLGKKLVYATPAGIVAGWIVEVEAYLWKGDPACHAARGMTPRNQIMFEDAGRLYVYSIHAKYCMNIVTEIAGRGAAVLIRAVEPCEGIELMANNRGLTTTGRELTSGPGRLCMAFAIDRSLNGVDLVTDRKIWIEEDDELSPSKWRIQRSGRVGINVAQEKPWRFFVDGHRYVSGRAMDHRVKRNWAFAEIAAGRTS